MAARLPARTALFASLVFACIFASATGARAEPVEAPAAAQPAARTARTLFVPAVSAELARLRPTWRDAAFATGAAGLTAALWANDVTLERRIVAKDSPAQRDAARILKPFGNEVVIASGVLAWGAAWAYGDQAMFLRVQRADLSIVSAVACTYVLKEIVGRKRPDESPTDASRFEPFSSHDAFPSGHATMAFAAATALDRETRSGWVPAIGYPLAALVGWSRLHDRRHWPSDVAAGAAIGFGVAWKAEDVMQPRDPGTTGARLTLESGDGALAALRLRW